jgi:hypothetical protein
MASGTWRAVPMQNSLADIDPSMSPRFNPNYPNTPEWSDNLLRQSTIVTAWCGAAFDDSNDNMWLGLGGGHGAYGGNEMYRCNFNSDTPIWEMVRAPSGAVGNRLATRDGMERTGVYSDGRPRACHTYNNWVVAPGVGPVLAAHSALSWSAAEGKRWSVWIDPNTGEHAFGPDEAGLSTDNIMASGACYDSRRRAIWLKQKGLNRMFKYTLPSAGQAHKGSWTAVGDWFTTEVSVSTCYMPEHDCILVGTNTAYAPGQDAWSVFDCATATWYTPTFNGSVAAGLRAGECQPRWVSALGAACVWDNASDTTRIARLTPGANPRRDAWTISSLPVASGNSVTPSAKTANGTFGRFAYSQRLGGFLVLNSTAGPTYFYKL